LGQGWISAIDEPPNYMIESSILG